MTNIILTGTDSCVTAVPNAFIDRYLPEADGEYVKIYLLLWRFYSGHKDVTVSQIADILDDTEKDVIRALRYWAKRGLLKLSFNPDKEINGIFFLPVEAEDDRREPERETAAAQEFSAQETAEEFPGQKAAGAFPAPEREKRVEDAAAKKPAGERAHAPSAAKRKELAVDEEFGQLVYIVGKYLGEPLKSTGSDILGYLYGELGMRSDLLEYLVETCVDSGHKSLHYMEKIALDWHERGITSVEEAKEQEQLSRRQYYQVLKAFGLGRRGPAPEEKKQMDVWFYDYGFQMDIVLEACSRTIRALHEPSFEYAGGILTDWKKKGVRSREDVARLDAAFAREKEAAKARRKENSRTNRFHNFDQVGYDYDAIVKELNG